MSCKKVAVPAGTIFNCIDQKTRTVLSITDAIRQGDSGPRLAVILYDCCLAIGSERDCPGAMPCSDCQHGNVRTTAVSLDHAMVVHLVRNLLNWCDVSPDAGRMEGIKSAVAQYATENGEDGAQRLLSQMGTILRRKSVAGDA